MSETVNWQQPECGEDEDPVDFLTRAAEYYCTTPAPAPPGFLLVECDATPRHWPIYEIDTGGEFYPMPCLYCTGEYKDEEVARLKRRHHWIDHPLRGRFAVKVMSWAYSMGIIAGFGSAHGGLTHCRSCINGVRFKGRRPYILGRERD